MTEEDVVRIVEKLLQKMPIEVRENIKELTPNDDLERVKMALNQVIREINRFLK